jgi:hypothetical protein
MGLKAIKLVFVASLLSVQHQGVRAKTGWLAIEIILYQIGAICLPTEDYFSVLAF